MNNLDGSVPQPVGQPPIPNDQSQAPAKKPDPAPNELTKKVDSAAASAVAQQQQKTAATKPKPLRTPAPPPSLSSNADAEEAQKNCAQPNAAPTTTTIIPFVTSTTNDPSKLAEIIKGFEQDSEPTEESVNVNVTHPNQIQIKDERPRSDKEFEKYLKDRIAAFGKLKEFISSDDPLEVRWAAKEKYFYACQKIPKQLLTMLNKDFASIPTIKGLEKEKVGDVDIEAEHSKIINELNGLLTKLKSEAEEKQKAAESKPDTTKDNTKK